MGLAPRRLVNLVEPNADVVVERVSQASTALTDGRGAWTASATTAPLCRRRTAEPLVTVRIAIWGGVTPLLTVQTPTTGPCLGSRPRGGRS